MTANAYILVIPAPCAWLRSNGGHGNRYARADLIPAIKNGYPLFVRRDHIYPVFAPDKAINDANKILARVEENAIVFAPWDKLYSYVYTAHIEEGLQAADLSLSLKWQSLEK